MGVEAATVLFYDYGIQITIYLVVGLFQDLVQTPRNVIYDTKFLGYICVPQFQNRAKWAMLFSKYLAFDQSIGLVAHFQKK